MNNKKYKTGNMKKSKKYKKTWGSKIGQDCINLDTTLAGWLAPRLKFLSKHANGHPDQMPYEEWTKSLKENAKKLKTYANKWDSVDWNLESENKKHDDAREAFEWVAKWFENLWD